MKKVLFSVLACCSMIANAALTAEFSYGEGQFYFTGARTSSAQTFDVAIFLPGEDFCGWSIKQIKAPIYTPSGTTYFTDMSVWLSSQLPAADSKNNTDKF